MKRVFLILFILSIAIGSCNAQLFHKNASRKAERGLFGKSTGKKREAKVKEPGVVLKAKKKQEAKDRKLKKDYTESVRKSQKRTIDIQTPEVQDRMKQDKKNTKVRDNAKRKKSHISTKKAGMKYK